MKSKRSAILRALWAEGMLFAPSVRCLMFFYILVSVFGVRLDQCRRAPLSGITLVLHGDVSKLPVLATSIGRWNGPTAVVIYVRSQEDARAAYDWAEKHQSATLGWTLVFRHDHYPVNLLRNISIGMVKTELYFLLDADFLPPDHLYDKIMKSYDRYAAASNGRYIGILPFQTRIDKYSIDEASTMTLPDPITLPNTREDLFIEWDKGNIIPSYSGNNDYDTHYLRSYNINKWRQTAEPYPVVTESGFEPYIIMRTATSPLFDERFAFYGGDKIQFFMHLQLLGITSMIDPSIFVIHYPHVISTWPGMNPYLLINAFLDDFKKKRLAGSSQSLLEF